MLYFYTPTITEGCLDLAKTLDAKRLYKFDGMQFLRHGRPVEFTPDDVIVCWGKHVPTIPNIVVLNNNLNYPSQLAINKRLYALDNIGSRLQFIHYGNNRMYAADMVNKQKGNYKNESGMVPSKEFEGYGTRYYNIKTEYSLHVFKDKIIYGTQTARVFGVATATKISSANAKVVASAQNVLQVLGLDFGKVTICTGENGVPVVRKVITAPELTPELVTIYANNFRELLAARKQVENDFKGLEL